MTRLFTDGAEFGDTLFWDIGGANLSAATDQVYTGTYSYKNSNSAPIKNITPVSEFYFRARARWDNTQPKIIDWRNSTTSLGYVLWMNTNGLIQIYVGGNLVATGAIPLTTGTWYLIEVHVKIADVGGTIEVKIDGIADATFSGDTKPGSQTTVDNFTFNSGQGFYWLWLDDLAMNDTSNSDGLNDNSWCGDGRVVLLRPNGNGNANQFTGSDGNSTDNYLLVDEVPHDTDTTYVEDNVSGHQDLYDLGDFAGSGVTPLRAWAEARVRDTAAAGGTIHLGVRTYATDYKTASARSLITSYARVVGDTYKTNPNTAAAWTDAELDAVQFLAEIP